MTTASSEQLLEAEALNYLEGRVSFADLYGVAADVLPDFIHADIKRSVSFVGAILNAEIEYTDDDVRREAVSRALLAARGVEVRRISPPVTSSCNHTQKRDLLSAAR